MILKAIALDDEPPALKLLENFCKQTTSLQLVKTFTRPSEALKYLRKFPVDLIFLDIQMPSLSGIDFCKIVPPQTMVIFVTAYSEFAVEGFNLNAVDYLLKPYSIERFQQAVEKAADYFKYLSSKAAIDRNFIFIRADYQLIKVNTKEIVYIEGCDDYIKIILDDEKILVARMTMKAIQERLSSDDFLRVHRSFIVAVGRIERVRNKNIVVSNREIPIGSSYEDPVMEFIGAR
jgi:DNA-binding LytR/AlgR family response regulator